MGAIKFKLTVELEGNSLSEIDDLMMDAAGARLVARLSKPIVNEEKIKAKIEAANLAVDKKIAEENVKAAISEVSQPENVTHIETEKKKAGRPKKVQEVETAPVVETKSPVDHGFTTETAAPIPIQPTLAPTKDEAIKALSKVNEAHGIDTARTILTQFNVKRLAELEVGQYTAFIASCEAACR